MEQLIKSLEGILTCISKQEKAVEVARDKLRMEGEHINEKIGKYVEDITAYIFAQKESVLMKLNVFLTQQMESFCLAQKELQNQ